jgi:uncharacterized membrane protein YbhN (UPF0104 family)
MHTKSKISNKRKEIIWLGLTLLAFYVIVPQIKGFGHSWHLIEHPRWSYVYISGLCIALTYVLSALIFLCLSKKKLKLAQEVIVQVAANFVNKLLPAGIGGIGANIQYLRHVGYSKAEAASITATNNLLGIVGHLLIVGTALLVVSTNKVPKISSSSSEIYIALAVILAFAVGSFAFYEERRKQARKILSQIKKQFVFYKDYPSRLVLALICQMSITIMNVLCLFFAANAIGLSLHFIPTLFIFTFGSAVRNFTPTPGGIGGYEASLVAGLIAYKASDSQALAAVLIYRLISYWIPLVISGFTFIYATKKELLEA